MTKTFCDICNKELSDTDILNKYKVVITGEEGGYIPIQYQKHIDDVCPECVMLISNFIESLRP